MNAPLARLADYIKANDGHPAGNATLVIRNQADANGQVADGGADLYTDSGAYYWAPGESGLPAEIAAHDNVGAGMFAREVAAAIYAVNGNLATACERMANAPLDHPGVNRSVKSALSVAQARARRLGLKTPLPTLPRRRDPRQPPANLYVSLHIMASAVDEAVMASWWLHFMRIRFISG